AEQQIVSLNLRGAIEAPVPGEAETVVGAVDADVAVIILVIDPTSARTGIALGGEAAEAGEFGGDVVPDAITEADAVQVVDGRVGQLDIAGSFGWVGVGGLEGGGAQD